MASRTVKISTSGKRPPSQVKRINLNRLLSIGFKSPATISQAQDTVQYDGTPGTLAARGRHDPCVVPRAVPIVEAMAAIVVLDQLLQQDARKTAASRLPPINTLPPTMVMPPKRV